MAFTKLIGCFRLPPKKNQKKKVLPPPRPATYPGQFYCYCFFHSFFFFFSVLLSVEFLIAIMYYFSFCFWHIELNILNRTCNVSQHARNVSLSLSRIRYVCVYFTQDNITHFNFNLENWARARNLFLFFEYV